VIKKAESLLVGHATSHICLIQLSTLILRQSMKGSHHRAQFEAKTIITNEEADPKMYIFILR
jgi:hypothetical protein